MKLCRLVKLSKIERSLELIIIIHNEIKIFGIEKHMAASYPAVYKQENIKFLGIGTINNKYPLSTSWKTRKQVGETKLFGTYYKNLILKLINLAPEKTGILIFVPSYQILEKIQLPDVINKTVAV
ncbi:MAG: hypothetical protein HeimC3_30450 [Candidatus Heimdallarchaeota archaeon LC_3]|nr:MAG: hypothetical protein HeimC3_30450 [Candidatus Heimdallarchaeota archaeon LC_3]